PVVWAGLRVVGCAVCAAPVVAVECCVAALEPACPAAIVPPDTTSERMLIATPAMTSFMDALLSRFHVPRSSTRDRERGSVLRCTPLRRGCEDEFRRKRVSDGLYSLRS